MPLHPEMLATGSADRGVSRRCETPPEATGLLEAGGRQADPDAFLRV